jgi:hypothetical protein
MSNSSTEVVETEKEEVTTAQEETAGRLKISPETLEILKNFSNINPNMMFKAGNQLFTMSMLKNIISIANVPEKFPNDFGVYDLGQLLGVLSLFKSPSLEFDEKFLTISSEGGSSVKYFYSAPDLLRPEMIVGSHSEFKMPPIVISFNLTDKMLSEMLRAASVMQLSDLQIASEGAREPIELVLYSPKNETSNRYTIEVGKNETQQPFSMHFKIDNLKLLPGDYKVDIAEKAITHFVCADRDLQYYIALEADSKFGK